jgi:hypothetical protein
MAVSGYQDPFRHGRGSRRVQLISTTATEWVIGIRFSTGSQMFLFAASFSLNLGPPRLLSSGYRVPYLRRQCSRSVTLTKCYLMPGYRMRRALPQRLLRFKDVLLRHKDNFTFTSIFLSIPQDYPLV